MKIESNIVSVLGVIAENYNVEMKKLALFLIAVCAATVSFGQSETSIILQGNYQGKNIYVQNPFGTSGVGFCVKKVTINGDVTTDEINSSAFEIDFANFKLEVGAPVEVEIFHSLDCSPKVINPQVLKPQSTFTDKNIAVGGDKVLSWTTTGETGKLPYIVEQYRWNKWIKIGEVDGIGTADEHTYQFKVTPHSGENKFRVKQVDYTGKPKFSKIAKFEDAAIPAITYNPKQNVKKEIVFTGETLFEIHDTFGNIVKKGFGEKIDCSGLEKGMYYLSFDNINESFTKK